MPITVTLDREQTQAVISAACRARQHAEIRLRPHEGPPITRPTTLLMVDAHRLYVERPTAPAGPLEPAPGEQILLTFNTQGRRFKLETTVSGARPIVIADGVTADAIELKSPRTLYELQRRADYRVPLWNKAPVIAHFEPLPVGPVEVAARAVPFRAELQNISAGGVAALVTPSGTSTLARGQSYLMDFFLPGGDEPFNFIVTVRHVRPMTHSDTRLVGFKFVAGDDAGANRQAIQKIRSFVEVHRRLKA
jgi:c-di-GMP-binding flagellar brake protein YcgR